MILPHGEKWDMSHASFCNPTITLHTKDVISLSKFEKVCECLLWIFKWEPAFLKFKKVCECLSRMFRKDTNDEAACWKMGHVPCKSSLTITLHTKDVFSFLKLKKVYECLSRMFREDTNDEAAWWKMGPVPNLFPTITIHTKDVIAFLKLKKSLRMSFANVSWGH